MENGMLHGKGTIEWPDGITFNGDIFRSEITGIGNYTYADKSFYEGHLVKGIRNGEGTFTSGNNEMTYCGQWSNGQKHGVGRISYDAKKTTFYLGEWARGARHGKGRFQYSSGNFYDGDWKDDQKCGYGTMEWLDRKEDYPFDTPRCTP